MLIKKNRLSLRSEKKFFDRCRSKNTKFFQVFYIFDTSQPTRVAIRVTKSVSKSAVARHQLRRKISGFFERKLGPQSSTIQLLVVTKRECGILNWLNIEKDLEEVWTSLVHLKKKLDL